MQFPTNYRDILDRIEQIDPLQYGTTRNFIDGQVSYLSPYISRGVISVKQVMDSIFSKGYTLQQSKNLLQQLAWREYFQRVWQHLEDDIFDDIRHANTGVQHRTIQTSVTTAATGIESIDNAINKLYQEGYIHNHLRMYTASICCNIGKAYWQMPSEWMYYYLLDGDLASNTCSWQWVAGSFSSKQYFCNQENINRYTRSNQQHTFLDKTYAELPLMNMPEVLKETASFSLKTILPEKQVLQLDHSLPLLIYNSYNLDPLWKSNIKANRILLLEPSHFKQFPVSEKVIDFILQLSKNINGLQVFTGEVNEIPAISKFPAVYSKEHTAFNYYPGIKDERDWMFPQVKGFYNSYFGFWKKCEHQFLKNEKVNDQLLKAS